jgi:hypothetical protein
MEEQDRKNLLMRQNGTDTLRKKQKKAHLVPFGTYEQMLALIMSISNDFYGTDTIISVGIMKLDKALELINLHHGYYHSNNNNSDKANLIVDMH